MSVDSKGLVGTPYPKKWIVSPEGKKCATKFGTGIALPYI